MKYIYYFEVFFSLLRNNANEVVALALTADLSQYRKSQVKLATHYG